MSATQEEINVKHVKAIGESIFRFALITAKGNNGELVSALSLAFSMAVGVFAEDENKVASLLASLAPEIQGLAMEHHTDYKNFQQTLQRAAGSVH